MKVGDQKWVSFFFFLPSSDSPAYRGSRFAAALGGFATLYFYPPRLALVRPSCMAISHRPLSIQAKKLERIQMRLGK